MKFRLISVFIFLIPLFLSLLSGVYIQFLSLGLVILFAYLFHLSNEKKWETHDWTASLLLVAVNSYLMILSGLRNPYFIFGVMAVVIAFIFRFFQERRSYDFYHGLWHVTSAFISLMCLGSYLGGITFSF